jgi:hypothetical protein
MKCKSKNTGAEEKNENPFLVGDPAAVWEEWKKKGIPISREELERKLIKIAQLQKQRG